MTERFKKHVPNALDRQLLVWYKEFPSKQQIPTAVEESLMKKIHNKARVHGMFIMLGLATVGYIFTVMEGKKALRRGESIDKVNEQMHERYRKMYGDQGANK